MKPRDVAEEAAALARVAGRVGHEFACATLLQDALTHSSMPGIARPCASERMEYLGDAVIDLAIAAMLFERHPEWSEGQLSLGRSDCVRASTLAGKARALGMDEALRVGPSEEKTGGRRKQSILAAAYEAVIGAVFLDAGYGAAEALIRRHFAADVVVAVPGATDFKTQLQEQTQAHFGTIPSYHVTATAGPDHARQFVVAVEIAGQVVAEGRGSSKRSAEQEAASRALQAAFPTGGPAAL